MPKTHRLSLPSCKYGIGTVVLLIVFFATGASAAWATNPSSNPNGSFGGCAFGGYSQEFGDSTDYDDFSQTQRPPYTYCVDLMQVYAYFWGSDSQWYYRESGWESGIYYAAVGTPYWGYWTNRVYGYHWIQEPTGTYSGKITTDAN
jgi:hypothetical protein